MSIKDAEAAGRPRHLFLMVDGRVAGCCDNRPIEAQQAVCRGLQYES
jgi:hypothetical protein